MAGRDGIPGGAARRRRATGRARNVPVIGMVDRLAIDGSARPGHALPVHFRAKQADVARRAGKRRYDPAMSEEFQDILAKMHGEQFSLIPSEIYVKDHFQGTDVPFLDLMLVQLGYGPSYGLSAEQAVRDFVHGQPGMYEQVREVGTAVYQAGARARNHGLLRSSFDDSLHPYSADEIWCMDLALDVLAMLTALPRLSGGARFSALEALRDLYL